MGKGLTGNYKSFLDKAWLGEWDLPEDDDLIVTIDYVDREEVQNERGTEQRLTIHFKDGYKPMICNTTNAGTIASVTGSERVERWEGKKIQLYRESVRAFGKTTMAIRVRPFAPKQDEYICEECGAIITDSGKFKAKNIAISSKNQFGRVLCMECGKAAKEALEAEGGDPLGN